MTSFKKRNNILGFLLALAATCVYFLTAEPNASYWDCGEYIAVSAELGVPHAPGAALYQLIGAVLSIFSFGDPTKIPLIINWGSGLSSGLTVMFLFWTITHLAQKIIGNDLTYTPAQQIAILGSGLIGALSFAFTDSFWFSAVEGEVYAMAALFSAMLFWLVLKWESDNSPKADRWVVLICFVIGLSTGVHLMALLVVPAIGIIIYFKRAPQRISLTNFILGNIAIALVFGFIFKIIFPYTMKFFGIMEFFSINTLGLDFNVGTYLAFFLLAILFFAGLYLTYKKQKHYAHLAITSILFMLIGFSCWLVIPIRAGANPPLNLNDPSDAIGMLDYFNREQYGDWPILYGPTYAAYNYGFQGLNGYTDLGPIYAKNEITKKYEEIGRKKDYDFKSEYKRLFPRMYNPQSKEQYQRYLGKALKPDENPSFGDEVNFFVDYQLGYMYLRYLMFNFVGRQNDFQGNFELTRGNWMSGIPLIDNVRIGDQTLLPKKYTTSNKAHNHYFFIPFILGLLGFIFHFKRDKKRFYAILVLFLLTGMGILLYTNNKMFEPRERDYAYVFSFYTFSIWIGLAILSLCLKFKRLTVLVASSVTTLALISPFLLATQNWDDHDRSSRYTAYAEANNYLNACKPNAILFVYGDNDTYPLWTLQDVQRHRVDVKVINHLLLASPWHAQQAKRKTFDAEAVPSLLSMDDYGNKKNEDLIVLEDPTIKPLTAQQAIQFIADQKKGKYDGYLSNLKASLIKTASGQLNTISRQLEDIENALQNNLLETDQQRKEAENTWRTLANQRQLLAQFESEITSLDFKNDAVLPTGRIIIPVDKEIIIANRIVSTESRDLIVDTVHLNLPITYGFTKDGLASNQPLMKNSLMVLDILGNNMDWKRPVYFGAGGASDPENIFFLQDYLQFNGFVYQFVPILSTPKDGFRGSIDPKSLLYTYKHFEWGNLRDPKAYFDETSIRRNLISFRSTAIRLANAFSEKGEVQTAHEVLDKLMREVPYDLYGGLMMGSVINAYFKAHQHAKALDLAQQHYADLTRARDYYLQVSPANLATMQSEFMFDVREESSLIDMLSTTLNTHASTMVPKETIQLRSFLNTIEKFVDEQALAFLKKYALEQDLSLVNIDNELYDSYEQLHAQIALLQQEEKTVPDSLVQHIEHMETKLRAMNEAANRVVSKIGYNTLELATATYLYQSIIDYKTEKYTSEQLDKDSIYAQMLLLSYMQNEMNE